MLDRFGNPAIRDTNQRVAMDGFSKIPGFIAPTLRERLARGESIASIAMLPALFLAFLQRWHRGELRLRLPGPGDGPGGGACHLRRGRSGGRASAAIRCCGDRSPAIRGWSPRFARRTRRVAAFVAGEHDEAGDDSQDRHALLTGAGGGIGLAVTAAFLAEGARCTAVDLAAAAQRRHSPR